MTQENIIAVSPQIQTDVEVYWQDEVCLDLDLALWYIKSGEQEISNYVETVAKPHITEYTNDYAKPIVTQIVNETCQPLIDTYVEETVEPAIQTYVETTMSSYVTSTETAAASAENSAAAALASQQAAASSAESASTDAASAESSKSSAAVIQTDCEQLKADCQAIKSTLTGVYKWCGSVTSYDDLPTTDVEVGDVYNVLTTDMNYAWTDSGWDQLGSSLYNIGYGLTLADNTVSVNQSLVAMVANFQVVSVLPDSPTEGVFYFIKES